jgi:DNA-binding MarR family transcriptional regulator
MAAGGEQDLAEAKRSKSADLGLAEYRTLAAFRYTLRRYLAFSDVAASAVGLTQQQYQAMLVMKARHGMMSISELAAQLLVKHHSAVGLVDRLEQQGLVRREPSRSDRRKVVVRFTPHGARVFEKLAAAHRAELRRIGPAWGKFIKILSGPT